MAATIGALSVAAATPAGASQGGWKWCERCAGLWFSGNNTRGSCPAGDLFDGGHHSNGSGNYVLKFTSDGGAGEDGWVWCHNCQGLWSIFWHVVRGQTASRCPNGSPGPGHSTLGSGQYRIESLPDGMDGPGGQSNWDICIKCSGLFFAGNPTLGRCPGGGAHQRRLDPFRNYLLRQ
ncbi:hypothetical protein [Amycolatopsis sp. NPDC059021]|uniref:hypothetical protein n=1 Tax=Amycolatopsis sp. NPDC059021 TaxID=3346704 RepID=UPI00366DB916